MGFNWKTLSVIAGVTLWNFYFQIFEQTIKSEQIIEFLKLLRYIDGDILLIWDRLPVHRSQVTQQFIRDQKGRLETEYLPPYAPEMNPVSTSRPTVSTTNYPTSAPRIFGI
jgi:transposase